MGYFSIASLYLLSPLCDFDVISQFSFNPTYIKHKISAEVAIIQILTSVGYWSPWLVKTGPEKPYQSPSNKDFISNICLYMYICYESTMKLFNLF